MFPLLPHLNSSEIFHYTLCYDIILSFPIWIHLHIQSIYNFCPFTRAAAAAKLLQSCLTLCDPINRSPPGSPILGILQARTLEWVAISFSNV